MAEMKRMLEIAKAELQAHHNKGLTEELLWEIVPTPLTDAEHDEVHKVILGVIEEASADDDILTEDEIREIASEYNLCEGGETYDELEAKCEAFEQGVEGFINGTAGDEWTESNFRQYLEAWADA